MKITKADLIALINEELKEARASAPSPLTGQVHYGEEEQEPEQGDALGVSSALKGLGSSGSSMAATRFQEKPLQRALGMMVDALSKATPKKKREFVVTLLDQLGVDPATLTMAKSELTTLQRDKGAPSGVGRMMEMRVSKTRLRRLVREALRTEASAMTQIGGHDIVYDPSQGEPTGETVLRSSVKDAIELLKAGNAEAALGQLQAAVKTTMGGDPEIE
jgi:hypothetical protein